jgi:hypothetical protein
MTLEGIRASIAADAARKGPAGALARAILGFLETLLALIAAFRAGKLAAPVAREKPAEAVSVEPVAGAVLVFTPDAGWSAPRPNPPRRRRETCVRTRAACAPSAMRAARGEAAQTRSAARTGRPMPDSHGERRFRRRDAWTMMMQTDAQHRPRLKKMRLWQRGVV